MLAMASYLLYAKHIKILLANTRHSHYKAQNNMGFSAGELDFSSLPLTLLTTLIVSFNLTT
jgi:hypothetical protein